MQRFAIDCKKYVKTVIFTVVDVIGSEEITAAQEIADKLGIPLRVENTKADINKNGTPFNKMRSI